VFLAWGDNDQKRASLIATPSVLSTLFGHPWMNAANWTYDSGGGAAGHVYLTWKSGSNQLIIGGPDPGGGLYIYADNAAFS
jgi:hypothetical protein